MSHSKIDGSVVGDGFFGVFIICMNNDTEKSMCENHIY